MRTLSRFETRFSPDDGPVEMLTTGRRTLSSPWYDKYLKAGKQETGVSGSR
jgi:hypothetical protein